MGRKLEPGINDLATTHPHIAELWHPVKNGILKPADILAGSGKELWWRCKQGHEWQAAIYNRVNGTDCPVCSESHGEKAIRKILKDNVVIFKEQNKFPDRFYKTPSHPLRDDFAILNNHGNVIATIEYNGIQHYEPVDFAGKGQEWAQEQFKNIQEKDKIKTNYLQEHGILQLIIPYWDFNNIETIVSNYLSIIPLNCPIPTAI